MFDVVRNNPRIVQVFLGVLTIALGSWGIDVFRSGDSKEAVAQVGDTDITSQQFDVAFRNWQNSVLQQSGGAVDPSLLESPDARARVLDRLIDEEALKIAVRKASIAVSDGAVQSRIMSDPQFQENGSFSKALYTQLLTSAGTSPQQYEDEQRKSLAMGALLTPVMESAVTATSTAQRWIALDGEERTISEFDVDGKAYTDQVKLAADAAKKYYDANKTAFQVPEQVKLEYVVLSADEVAKNTQITEQQARDWYAANSHEERSARHILVQVSPTAKPEEREAAKKKAEALLAQVKKDPSKFAEIAKASSDDKVSAEKGGDLDYFTQKDMDEGFAKAAFELKLNEISGVVQSSFGYHIIMLTGIRGAKPFEQVKDDVYASARKEAASKQFSEMANQFSNIVWEQRDSLKPAADKFGLKLVQTDWIARDALPAGAMQNHALQQSLFAQESLTGHRNVEAVDAGNNTMVSARVIDYKASSIKPFEQVAALAEAAAKAEEAAKLAKAKGAELLGKLQAGAAAGDQKWAAARAVKRSGTELDGDARKAVFSAKTDKLPAYVGVARDQGYAIYRIDAVAAAKDVNDAARIKDIRARYANMLADEDQRALVAGMRSRLGVKMIEKK